MLKLIVYLAIIGGLAYCGATVKLGNKTFFEHVRAIWHTEEVQDLKKGVEDEAGPTVDKLEKGAKAGYNAMSGSGSAAVHGDAGVDAAR
ncbi:MAG: hypothetical protein ABI591_10405 [Kofleriaceae bacterium]